jgi:L-iditol 2-dehydrogenase
MIAALLYGPEDVRLERVPVPQPGPGEVLVKVAVALTDATDVKTFKRGMHPMLRTVPTPFGHEFAGTVAAVGAGVTRVQEGMRVVAANSAPCGQCFYCMRDRQSLCEDILFLNGSYAEYVVVPARIAAVNLYELPPDLSFAHAALMEPLACAVHGIDVADIHLGDTVAVNGAGAMGLMLARLAVLRGAQVIISDRFPERLELARRFGVRHTVLVDQGSDQVEMVRRLTEGERGVDIAIEAVGSPAVWEATVRMVRKGGLAMMFGGCAPGTTFCMDTGSLHYGELTVRGLFHHAPRYVQAALRLITEHQVDPDSLISGTMPLTELSTALTNIATNKGFKYALIP